MANSLKNNKKTLPESHVLTLGNKVAQVTGFKKITFAPVGTLKGFSIIYGKDEQTFMRNDIFKSADGKISLSFRGFKCDDIIFKKLFEEKGQSTLRWLYQYYAVECLDFPKLTKKVTGKKDDPIIAQIYRHSTNPVMFYPRCVFPNYGPIR